MYEGEVVQFEATITYDPATFECQRVEWRNPSSFPWRLALQSPGRPDIVVTIQPNTTGNRAGNQVRNYFIDGPHGAGFQLWPA